MATTAAATTSAVDAAIQPSRESVAYVNRKGCTIEYKPYLHTGLCKKLAQTPFNYQHFQSIFGPPLAVDDSDVYGPMEWRFSACNGEYIVALRTSTDSDKIDAFIHPRPLLHYANIVLEDIQAMILNQTVNKYMQIRPIYINDNSSLVISGPNSLRKQVLNLENM